jgi:uncharacterized protein
MRDSSPPMTLDALRRYAVAHSLFPPTTLKRALHKLGFVQADPIRAPARAQDLTLRHRVRDYRAGDLERRYGALGVEEDIFINYGFVTRELQALMHPRSESGVPEDASRDLPAARRRRAERLLQFVRERGAVHPRDADDHFAHGTVTNYWGGSSSATTHLLDLLHYQGLLRVARRDAGIRVYSEHRHAPAPADPESRQARIDALVDAVVRIYAPIPAVSLPYFIRRLRYAAPQWSAEMTAALQRARERLSHARAGGLEWYWPAGTKMAARDAPERVRLLAPFDPVVHDRVRFELLWGWEYRFEAYTPAAKRRRGYYALPLLWRDRVIGWANVSVKGRELHTELGYVAPRRPRERAFARELDAEIARMREFLGLGGRGGRRV